MMHLGDDFSRLEPANGPHPDSRLTSDNLRVSPDQAARDSTSESMFEKGLIQPEDL